MKILFDSTGKVLVAQPGAKFGKASPKQQYTMYRDIVRLCISLMHDNAKRYGTK